MALGIADGEGLAAIVHLPEIKEHLATTDGFDLVIERRGIGGDEGDRDGLSSAGLGGLDHVLRELTGDRQAPEQDHAGTEGELGVSMRYRLLVQPTGC